MNRRRSLIDLTLLAHCELATNSTITVYAMVDGEEVRRAANPLRELLESQQRLSQHLRAAARVATNKRPDAPNHLRHFDECPQHPENVSEK